MCERAGAGEGSGKGAHSDRRNSWRLEKVQMSSSFLRMTRMSTSVEERMTDDLEMKQRVKEAGEAGAGEGDV